VSSPIVASYDFLSYARRGAAADLSNVDPLTGNLPSRAPLAVTLGVESRDDGDVQLDAVSQTVLLYGPGDVTGIDPRHIVRTDPPDGTLNYEPNYLAGIEFDHPDFIWLFTPAAPNGNRLRPWLSLIVLAASEYKAADVPPTPLPAIDILDGSALPPPEDAWAWGHVQIAGQVAPTDLAMIFEGEPQRALSRLLCPRQLAQRTSYTAFLVPAFEFGRLAGLGLDVPDGPYPNTPATAPAWGGAGAVRLPYYFRFSFQTSELGDFESLVRQLQPRHLDRSVGVRPLDVTDAGWGLPPGGGPVALGGALRALDADTSWAALVSPAFQTDLVTYVNTGAATVPDDPNHDPVVEPPLYGRWQAAVTAVEPTRAHWIDQLNSKPENRGTAGFGTMVVLNQRGQLLASAWRQVEGILRANEMLRQAQLARSAATQLLTKHFAPATADLQLSLTAPLHTRILASPRTVAATLADTRLPQEALSPAFRRATRPRGAVRAWQARSRPGRFDLVGGLNRGALRAAPPLRPAAGLTSLEQVSDRFYPSWLPVWIRRVVAAPLWLLALISAVAIGALLLLGFLVGALIALLAIAAVVAALVAAVVVIRHTAGWKTAQGMRAAQITPARVSAAPKRPDFVLAEPGEAEPQPAPSSSHDDSVAARLFRQAATGVAGQLQLSAPDPAERPVANLARLSTTVVAQLQPNATIPARLDPLIRIDGLVAKSGSAEGDALAEIMAAPEFPQPMYRPLADLSQDYLLPGLEKVPPNTLGLLVENHAFIESYMVGLNHEMSRQLLWEEYPSDGRGSYFRQFWDVSGYVPESADPHDPALLRERLKDIPPIHLWRGDNQLGANPNRPVTGDGDLVLLVRGELLRRYPNALIYAVKAKWSTEEGRHELTDVEKHPIYRGNLLPDVTFFGFAMRAEEARGSTDPRDPEQGWFFVLEQHATEPRFGLEPPPTDGSTPQVSRWNDLSWANFGSPPVLPATSQPQSVIGPVLDPPPPEQPDNPGDPQNHWGQDAAQTAFILLRRPVRVAVHARTMLPEQPA
jgi:hypothetical protein